MGKKLDKAFRAMNESNRLYIEDLDKKENNKDSLRQTAEDSEKTAAEDEISDTGIPAEAEEKIRENKESEKLPLEKGDVPALILSALLVFGPVFLILIAVIVLAWIFLK